MDKKTSNYEKMTAPCGLACFNCVVYLANKDAEVKKRVAKQFDMPEEEVGCPGCREVKGKCPVVPMSCRVFPCAEKKDVKFCCDCPDFPCDLLHPYKDKADTLPHNTKVFNLCLIKKMGLEKWAKEKAKAVKEDYFYKKWEM
jgi:hypothetical protein